MNNSTTTTVCTVSNGSAIAKFNITLKLTDDNQAYDGTISLTKDSPTTDYEIDPKTNTDADGYEDALITFRDK